MVEVASSKRALKPKSANKKQKQKADNTIKTISDGKLTSVLALRKCTETKEASRLSNDRAT
jgi:hypothetical protein